MINLENMSVEQIDRLYEENQLDVVDYEQQFFDYLGPDWKKVMFLGKVNGLMYRALGKLSLLPVDIMSEAEKEAEEGKLQEQLFDELFEQTPQAVRPFVNVVGLKMSCAQNLENHKEGTCCWGTIFGETFIIFKQ